MSLGFMECNGCVEDVEVMRIAVEEVVGRTPWRSTSSAFAFPDFIYVVWFICYCCSSVVI
jgi:hypothetical protein